MDVFLPLGTKLDVTLQPKSKRWYHRFGIKMTSEEIDIAFTKSVALVNTHSDPFPADVLLKLYAYFKIATNDRPSK